MGLVGVGGGGVFGVGRLRFRILVVVGFVGGFGRRERIVIVRSFCLFRFLGLFRFVVFKFFIYLDVV